MAVYRLTLYHAPRPNKTSPFGPRIVRRTDLLVLRIKPPPPCYTMARSRSDAHAARNEQVRNMFASLAEVTGMPPTSTTITGAAQTLKLDHNVENVPESQGAKIHWLGDANAHKLLLYYHGTSSTIHQSFIPVSRLTACSVFADNRFWM